MLKYVQNIDKDGNVTTEPPYNSDPKQWRSDVTVVTPGTAMSDPTGWDEPGAR